MGPGLDGRVLGRETERVEPDGRQHPIAPHGAVPDEQVAHGVVADVAHMSRTTRVGVHGEHVVGRPGIVVVDLVCAFVEPVLLPAGLEGLGVVAVGHPPRLPMPGGRSLHHQASARA